MPQQPEIRSPGAIARLVDRCGRAASAPPPRAELEPLERRVLLSVSASVDDTGLVSFESDGASQVLQIRINDLDELLFADESAVFSKQFSAGDGSATVSAAAGGDRQITATGFSRIDLLGVNGDVAESFLVDDSGVSLKRIGETGLRLSVSSDADTVRLLGYGGDDRFDVVFSDGLGTPRTEVYGGMGDDRLVVDPGSRDIVSRIVSEGLEGGPAVEIAETRDPADGDGNTVAFAPGAVERATAVADGQTQSSDQLVAVIDELISLGGGADSGVFDSGAPLAQPRTASDGAGPLLWSDIIDLGGLFEAFRSDLVGARGYSTTVTETTLGELVNDWLNGAAFTHFAGLGLDAGLADADASTFGASAEIVFGSDGSSGTVVSFSIDSLRTVVLRPDEATGLVDLGLTLPADASVTVEVLTRFDLVLDLSGAGVILASSDGSTAVTTTEVSISGDGSLGLLSGAFAVADDGGPVFDLSGAALYTFGDGLGVTAAGTLESELVFEPGEGLPATRLFLGQAPGTPAGSNHNIFFDLPGTATVSFAGGEADYQLLFDTSADRLLAGLERFVDWLADVETSPILSGQAPMVADLSVGEVLAFSELLRSLLLEPARDTLRVSAAGPAELVRDGETRVIDYGVTVTIDWPGIDAMSNPTTFDLIVSGSFETPAELRAALRAELGRQLQALVDAGTLTAVMASRVRLTEPEPGVAQTGVTFVIDQPGENESTDGYARSIKVEPLESDRVLSGYYVAELATAADADPLAYQISLRVAGLDLTIRVDGVFTQLGDQSTDGSLIKAISDELTSQLSTAVAGGSLTQAQADAVFLERTPLPTGRTAFDIRGVPGEVVADVTSVAGAINPVAPAGHAGFGVAPVELARPAFSNVSELLSLLNGAGPDGPLSIEWDAANDRLVFRFDFASDGFVSRFQSRLTNTLDLGRLTDLLAGAEVNIAAEFGGALVFGFDAQAGDRVALTQGLVSAEASQTGRLTDDTSFTLLLTPAAGDAVRVGVSLSAAATASNNSVRGSASLLSDLQTAVDSAVTDAGLDASLSITVSVSESADGLRFGFAASDGSAVTVAGASLAARDQLGLVTDRELLAPEPPSRVIQTLARGNLAAAIGGDQTVEFDLQIGGQRFNGIAFSTFQVGSYAAVVDALNTAFADAGIDALVEASFERGVRIEALDGSRFLALYAGDDSAMVRNLGFAAAEPALAGELPLVFFTEGDDATTLSGAVDLSWFSDDAGNQGSFVYGINAYSISGAFLRGFSTVDLLLDGAGAGFVSADRLDIGEDGAPLLPVEYGGSLSLSGADDGYVRARALTALNASGLSGLIDGSQQLVLVLPGFSGPASLAGAEDLLTVIGTMEQMLAGADPAVRELGLAPRLDSSHVLLGGAAPREGVAGACDVLRPGVLTKGAAAELTLSIGGVSLDVSLFSDPPADSNGVETQSNTDLNDLLADLEDAIEYAIDQSSGAASGSVTVDLFDGRVRLRHDGGEALSVVSANAEAKAAFGLTAGEESSQSIIAGDLTTLGGEIGEGVLSDDARFEVSVQGASGAQTGAVVIDSSLNATVFETDENGNRVFTTTEDGIRRPVVVTQATPETLAAIIQEQIRGLGGAFAGISVAFADGGLVLSNPGGPAFGIRVTAQNNFDRFVGPDINASADFQRLADALDTATIDDIAEALGAVSERLDGALDDPRLNAALPAVGLSIAEFTTFAERFGQAVADLTTARVSTFQAVEQALNELLGVDYAQIIETDPGARVFIGSLDAAAGGLRLSFDASFEDVAEFEYQLDAFTLASLASAVPADLDNPSVVLSPVGSPLSLAVLATTLLDLDVLIDYSSGAAEATIEAGSSVTVEFSVNETDLNLPLRIGPAAAHGDSGRIVFGGSAGGAAAAVLVLSESVSVDADVSFTTTIDGRGELSIELYDNAVISAGNRIGSGLLAFAIDDLAALLQALADGDTGTGVVDIVSTPLDGDAGNLAELAESPLSEILRDPRILIDGIDRVLGAIQTAIEAPFAALGSLPLVGDDILDGVQPMLDAIGDARAAVREFLENLYDNTIAQITDDGDLLEALREGLFEVFAGAGDYLFLDGGGNPVQDNAFSGNGPRIGILRDLAGDGNATVDLFDVLLDTSMVEGDAGGIQNYQYDFSLGQSYSVSLPFNLGFGVGDIGLDELLPNFGFEVDSEEGVTFDLSWDLRFGFGFNSEDIFYINAGQYESVGDPDSGDAPELALAVDVSIPDFAAAINLGLAGANITDGTTAPMKMTSRGQLFPIGEDSNLEGASGSCSTTTT